MRLVDSLTTWSGVITAPFGEVSRMKGRSDSSSPKSKALVGGSGSCANSSSVGFSLASLVSIIYE